MRRTVLATLLIATGLFCLRPREAYTSIVNQVGGRDDVWSASQALQLTYCINAPSFGTRYQEFVTAMNAAADDWEGAGRVNFVHVSRLDATCSRSSLVVFNVTAVRGATFLVRHFYPSTPRPRRELIVDAKAFGNLGSWTLTGVMRHELGHTIGLRHEHTRPEAGACFEDDNWRALTEYDSASVMHYPQCNGTNNGDLTLTSKDRTGIAILYP